MEKEFVPYELALKLKELGFKERCLTYYGGDKPMIYDGLTIHGWDHNTSFLNWTSRPTFQQAFRWFRENYKVYYTIEGSNKHGFAFCIYSENDDIIEEVSLVYPIYEQAELACLHKLIELIETKKEK
jgi:hypothetical protein